MSRNQRRRNRNRNRREQQHAIPPVNNANNNFNGFDDQDFQNMSIPAMLDDLARNPIGIGQGLWLINDTFLFAFVGMAVALFLLMEESDERLGITPEQKRARLRRFQRHRF